MLTADLEGCRAYMMTVARRYTDSRDDQEDVVQEVMLHSWENRARIRGRLENYLAVSIRHLCGARAKASARLETVYANEDWTFGVYSDKTSKVVDRIVLRDALDRLPADERRVVELHYYQDMTLAEIAESEHWHTDTIVRRLRRAKEQMRMELQEDYT